MLINQLHEDLTALANFLFSRDPLPPSYVRITAAAVLRKWFLDGWINKLSAATGARYSFKTHDTSTVVQAIEKEPSIEFFMTAGINLNGVPMRGIYVSKASAPVGGGAIIPVDKMPLELFKPSKLLKCKRVFFTGQWLDFEHIIRFVANKYGGVHLDTERELPWQNILEAAAQYFIAGNPTGLDKVQIIEPYSEKHQMLLVLPKEGLNIWNCLDIELLAAAQAFLNIHVDGQPVIEYPQ